ncbi:hypothetical protein F2P56_026180 [Juglans regia]|uniref:Uncharacterized protein n=2 Tax=Juglans regia TaxID=51240 RepID=A0A833URD0_JUGRE|nr:uncharacterized protein LOC108992209 isoform X2 [Juglans regia]KAF5456734.1 hypothetical protein F2P56_026180 [Juglans regia]
MLLRSASSPILKSSTSSSIFQPFPESDEVLRISTSRSLSLCLSSSSSSSPIDNNRAMKISRTMPDSNLRPRSLSLAKRTKINLCAGLCSGTASSRSSVGLDKGCLFGCGGTVGRGGSADGNEGNGNWDNGSEKMDEYYQQMIMAYPGDALLLGNYASFLKEVRGDFVKAEEYCEKAILADPGNENVLCLYGDLIWHKHKDAPRAQSYFDRAIHSSPNDCYVLGSYAKYLWDANEDDGSQAVP